MDLLLYQWDEAAKRLHIAETSCVFSCLSCASLMCSTLQVPQEVDLLLYQWDEAAKALEIAEAAFEASELTTRPTALIGGFCCCGRTKARRPLPPAVGRTAAAMCFCTVQPVAA